MHGVHHELLDEMVDVVFAEIEESAEVMQAQAEASEDFDHHPHLAEVAAALEQSGYDYAAESEWGLDLILDALEALRPGSGRACGRPSEPPPAPFGSQPPVFGIPLHR